jgi:hypothetical protein
MSRRITFYGAVTALALGATVAAAAAQPLSHHPGRPALVHLHSESGQLPLPDERLPLNDQPLRDEPEQVRPPVSARPTPTTEPGCPNCFG